MVSVFVTSDIKLFMYPVKSNLPAHRIKFNFTGFVTSVFIWLKYPVKSNILPLRIDFHFPEL